MTLASASGAQGGAATEQLGQSSSFDWGVTGSATYPPLYCRLVRLVSLRGDQRGGRIEGGSWGTGGRGKSLCQTQGQVVSFTCKPQVYA